ncbi:MAG: DUF4254 domain-containing protein [Bacteroidales bacterium]
MNIYNICETVFTKCIETYHINDNIDTLINNPYKKNTIENRLYKKSWIDTVQWHLEDIIRDPDIKPLEALAIKRTIDKSNQVRTDMVEEIDEYFKDLYADVKISPDARLNTESPAWAIDRLSILYLKVYHWNIEAERTKGTERYSFCKSKLDIMLEQKKDLSLSINQLINDIGNGKVYMKTYQQAKMYNDPSLNPILYKQNKK